MEFEEVEILINKNGQVTLSVRGAKGENCLVLTEDLEKLLGGEILSRYMTAEAAEINPNVIDQRQKLKK